MLPSLIFIPPRPHSFPRALAAFATAQTEPGMYSRDGNLNIEVGAGKSIVLKQGDQDEVDLLAQLASLEADLASYEVKKKILLLLILAFMPYVFFVDETVNATLLFVWKGW